MLMMIVLAVPVIMMVVAKKIMTVTVLGEQIVLRSNIMMHMVMILMV